MAVPLISREEIEEYIRVYKPLLDDVPELLKKFHELKQCKIVTYTSKPGSLLISKEESFSNTSFRFQDTRGATLFVAQRLQHLKGKLSVHRIFDAPQITRTQLKNILPLLPQNFLTFTQYYPIQSTGLFYSSEETAFKLPLFELINEERHKKDDIYFIKADSSMSIELFPDNNLGQLNFGMDKYSGVWHDYLDITIHIKIRLTDLEIVDYVATHEVYKH